MASLYLGSSTRLQLKMSDDTLIHFDRLGGPLSKDEMKNGQASIAMDKIFVFQKGLRVY